MDRSADANGFARKGRWGLIAAATAIACVSLAPAGAQAAAKGSSTQCPGTFTVLHDDSIGALKLKAGPLRDHRAHGADAQLPEGLEAVRQVPAPPGRRPPQPLEAQRPQGGLPQGHPRDGLAFSVAKFRGGGGEGGGGGGGGSNRTKCPTFQVLHNDRIGSLPIPAGNYLITAKNMGCPSASQQFAKFLQSPSGRLGGGWQLKPRKAKFRNPNTGESFRIKQQ